jgi:hypothetical protein
MKTKRALNIKTSLLPFFAVAFVFSSFYAQAQTSTSKSQLVLTWQANNFYPADYAGKASATPDTPVTVSAEILSDGKLIDASLINFNWTLDGKFLARGQGVKETSFKVLKGEGEFHVVGVSAQTKNGQTDSSLMIPVERPHLALEVPYPEKILVAGKDAAIQAIPYFWNITSFDKLVFFWTVNGGLERGINGNSAVISVGQPNNESEKTLFLSIFAQNQANPLELVKENYQLDIK